MPRFSIVIPTYNRANSIAKTLDSVFSQSMTDFEVVVVDDGSTDNTGDVVSKYVDRKALLYYFQPNRGVSSARNFGAEKASGEYLLFLDSDDSVAPNWLLDYEKNILEDGADLLYCGITRIKHGVVVGYTDPVNPYNDGVACGNFIPGSFCLKRELFESVGGYDPILSYSENTELSFRLKQKGLKEKFISACNLLYEVSEDGLSRNWLNRKKAMLHIIKKHSNMFVQNKQLKKRYLTIAGVSAIHCSSTLEARRIFKETFFEFPCSFGLLIRYVVTFFPYFSKKIWKKC